MRGWRAHLGANIIAPGGSALAGELYVRLPHSSEEGELPDLDALFSAIRARVEDTRPDSDERKVILSHLYSLARWNREPMDYPEVGVVTFPAILPIAFAVCHPECGASEFLVDGSTQECEYCGGQLFRTETRDYVLKEPAT